MTNPDYVIYLDMTPETSLRRVQKRSRCDENKYSREYLESVISTYRETFKDPLVTSLESVILNVDYNNELEVIENRIQDIGVIEDILSRLLAH